MKRSDRLTEILFIVVALAIAALIVLHQVDKISHQIAAQVKARAERAEIQR